uniref:Uncharacterized protein n=1 Tax=Caenorhabditis japonica TaxID=281687 RepID=A0A8R1EDS9_CAEJA
MASGGLHHYPCENNNRKKWNRTKIITVSDFFLFSQAAGTMHKDINAIEKQEDTIVEEVVVHLQNNSEQLRSKAKGTKMTIAKGTKMTQHQKIRRYHFAAQRNAFGN